MENEKRTALHEVPYKQQYGGDVQLIQSNGQVETEGLIEGFRVRGTWDI